MVRPPSIIAPHRVTAALPKVAPLTLKRRREAFDDADCLFELKYDGYRALLEIHSTGARLVSRNRNRFKHLDTLAAALARRLRVKDAILDGEIICADETGRPQKRDLRQACPIVQCRSFTCKTRFLMIRADNDDATGLEPCQEHRGDRRAGRTANGRSALTR